MYLQSSEIIWIELHGFPFNTSEKSLTINLPVSDTSLGWLLE